MSAKFKVGDRVEAWEGEYIGTVVGIKGVFVRVMCDTGGTYEFCDDLLRKLTTLEKVMK